MTNLFYKISGKWFLFLCVTIAYLPFLNLRVLRMAGDEKVYVSQAIEMARDGRWFTQTLAGEPNYFKGPLHYVLVRAGLAIFGDSLIAATWMNLLFALLAAFAMYRLGSRRWNEKSGILLGVATALNVGVFSHAFASQMEVELTAFYAICIAILGLAPKADKPDSWKWDLAFWSAAGMAAWVKSPLHSVLLGISGILYWAISRQLAVRMKSVTAWAAVFGGIFVAVLGYLPAFLSDRENFLKFFLGRENLDKANNNRSWDYVVSPLVHFSMPWFFGITAAMIAFLRNWKKPKQMDASIVELGLSFALPTILFFATFRYKGQNYNLPTLPALFVFALAVFNGELPRWIWRAVGVIGVLAGAALFSIYLQFWPLPQWWSLGWVILSILSLGFFIWIFLTGEDVRLISAGAVSFFICFGSVIAPLGEREMIEAREFFGKNPDGKVYYYNLDPSIWSEWGLLQMALGRTIEGLHQKEKLLEIAKPGNILIVQNPMQLKSVLDGKTIQTEIKAWPRWLTKGKTAEGQARWRAAWQGRDISQLEREFYFIKFQ